MNVIVDTSVWSLSLRRNNHNDGIEIINILHGLIANGQVVLLGVIRQELLSGIRYAEQFSRLRDYLLTLSKRKPGFRRCLLVLANSQFLAHQSHRMHWV